MPNNVIDEYLVKLGAVVDLKGFNSFRDSLDKVSNAVAKFTGKSSADFAEVAASLETVGLVLGGVATAITVTAGAAATLGYEFYRLASQTASTDMNYQLFAMHMRLTAQSGKELKIITETLGADLPDIFWNPELKRNALLMKGALDSINYGPNYAKDLQQIRTMNTLLAIQKRTLIEYGGVAITKVLDGMNAIGVGPQQLIPKLWEIEKWLLQRLPAALDNVGAWFSQFKGPALQTLQDVWTAAKDIGHAFVEWYQAANGVSQSIFGRNLFPVMLDFLTRCVKATLAFVDALAKVADFVASLIRTIIQGLSGVARAMDDLVHGNFKGAMDDLGHGLSDAFDTAWGAVKRDAMLGPQAGGDNTGQDTTARTALQEALAAHPNDANLVNAARIMREVGTQTPTNVSSTVRTASDGRVNVRTAIDATASALGIDPALAHALARAESGERNLPRGTTSSATGVYQLLKGTAGDLGVDATDVGQNVLGGLTYFKQQLQKYGDVTKAIIAWHDGPGAMNRILAGKATASPAALAEVQAVKRYQAQERDKGNVDVGGVNIYIKENHADSSQLKDAVNQGVHGRQTQRNLQEFNTLSWSPS